MNDYENAESYKHDQHAYIRLLQKYPQLGHGRWNLEKGIARSASSFFMIAEEEVSVVFRVRSIEKGTEKTKRGKLQHIVATPNVFL
jgi:hypothetical protein